MQKPNEEQIRLQQDLDFEKKRAIKFVSQNVEREREIKILKKDLKNQIGFCNRLAEHPYHLIDSGLFGEKSRIYKVLLTVYLENGRTDCDKLDSPTRRFIKTSMQFVVWNNHLNFFLA